MTGSVPRWIEVSRSDYSHEREGLAYLRTNLPAAPPYRAWTNFEFMDGQGRWNEVDALVLGRGRLHLVELKHYRGTLGGNEVQWIRNGRRREQSPLLLARRKAQRLASRLRDEMVARARRTGENIGPATAWLPFIQETVFLHAADLDVELAGVARSNLFAFGGRRPGALPDIMDRLTEPAGQQSIRDIDGVKLTALLGTLGIARRPSRPAGSWLINGAPIDEGDGWQDWPGEHGLNADQQVRIRVFLTPAGAPQSARQAIRRRVSRERQLLQTLRHDGILTPDDEVETEEGDPGLVYRADDSHTPLDELPTDTLTADARLIVLEKVADALAYAHRHRVAHRGLTPHAVLVAIPAEAGGEPDIRIADWSSVGRIHQDPASRTALGTPDCESSGTAELYEAPEGRLSPTADRQALDIFSLGALAYFLLAGSPPATDRAELRERIRDGNGLDLAAARIAFVRDELRQLVLHATRPAVTQRLASAAEFADAIRRIRAADAAVEDEDQDPLELAPGGTIKDRFELRQILGEGSTARGLLVHDHDHDEERVLKVGTSLAAAGRLEAEAQVLRALGDLLPARSNVVRLIEGPIPLPHNRTALLLSSGGTGTLGGLLRMVAMSLADLRELGRQLLEIMMDLDGAGVLHRDVKPANLGIAEQVGGPNRLTLFDFSLARQGVSDLVAGTPPYLDPFLGTLPRRPGEPRRAAYDSAAEWYAAAVVLFEMATSSAPNYGDGASDPALIDDDVNVETGYFISAQGQPAVAEALTVFFRRALSRFTANRFGTITEMRDAWVAAFTVPDRAPAARRRRTPALPPTVPDGSDGPADQQVPPLRELVRDLGRTAGGSGTAARRLVYLLVPTDPGPDEVDPLATQGAFAQALGVTPGRVAQLFEKLPEKWHQQPALAHALARLGESLQQALKDVGGVATPALLADALTAQHFPLPEDAGPDEQVARERTVTGLVRLLLERSQRTGERWERRRFHRRIAAIAVDPLHLDVADAVAAEAERLVRSAAHVGTAVLGADLVLPRLRAAADALLGDPDAPDAGVPIPDRVLLRIAAAGTDGVCLSAADELHRPDLALDVAVDLVLRGVPVDQQVRPADLASRVAARFPALAGQLPDRPALDELMTRVRPDLPWRAESAAYAGSAPPQSTSVGSGRQRTREGAPARSPIGPRAIAHLADGPVFRAFEVPRGRSDELADALVHLLGGGRVDVTAELLGLLRERAAQAQVPWTEIVAADAGPTADRQGLAAFVDQALPALFERTENAVGDGGPVVVTDLATLAAYGLLGRLNRWTDVTRPPPRTILALVPRGAPSGPLVDGVSLPLNSPDQFVALANRDVDEIIAAAGARLATVGGPSGRGQIDNDGGATDGAGDAG